MEKLKGKESAFFLVKGGVFESQDAFSENYKNPQIPLEEYTNPNDSDYYRVNARHISAGLVKSGSRIIDFPESVLKSSLPFFKDLKVYADHHVQAGASLGYMKQGVWSEAQIVNDQMMPAGIDGIVAIDSNKSIEIDGGNWDGKFKISGADIIRELKMPVPSSFSVQVEYEWEASHSFENMWDFRNAMENRLEKDGELVRMIVTKITRYYETSFVWEGAVPTAKTKMSANGETETDTNDVTTQNEKPEILVSEFKVGNLVGKANSQFSAEPKTGQIGVSEDTLSVLGLEIQGLKKQIQEKELALQDMTGKLETETEKATLAESQLSVALQAETEYRQKFENLQTVNATLSELIEKIVEQKRSYVVSQYRLLMGDKANETTIELLQNTRDLNELEALGLKYQTENTSEFAYKCPKCSEPITSLSSVVPEQETGNAKPNYEPILDRVQKLKHKK